MEEIIVLTGTIEEFEKWCMENNHTRKTAVQITHPSQFQFYPDLEIVTYGTYWLNNAFNSPEYKNRIEEMALKESYKND